MIRLRVVPIVEGHGEVAAVRTLLERIWYELLGGDSLEILQPIRQPRSKIVKPDELLRAVRLAKLKLAQGHPFENGGEEARGTVLLLIDADDDLPCELAPQLVEIVLHNEADVDFACVIANPEYETWFVGAAESLGRPLTLGSGEEVPDDPESARSKKGWLEAHFSGPYSPTVDQPKLTAAMDLSLCRDRCRSFDKLCRELDQRLNA